MLSLCLLLWGAAPFPPSFLLPLPPPPFLGCAAVSLPCWSFWGGTVFTLPLSVVLLSRPPKGGGRESTTAQRREGKAPPRQRDRRRCEEGTTTLNKELGEAPPPKRRRKRRGGGRKKKAPPIHPCQTQTHTQQQPPTPTTPQLHHAEAHNHTPPQDITPQTLHQASHTTQYHNGCLCYISGQNIQQDMTLLFQN